MTQFAEPPPLPAARPLKPHRGTLVLVFGILGVPVCVFCGIIAWVMGSNDLREMKAGTMDPSGRGLTKAGKICGMVGTFFWLAMFCLFVVIDLLPALARRL